MDENANKLHFKFTAFNSSMRVTVYAELCVSRIAFKGIVFFGKMWVALKIAGCCVVAFNGYVNCACVPQLFSTAY